MKTLVHVIALLSIGVFLATVVTGDPETTAANAPKVSEVGEMTTERAAHQATVLPSGHVLITGGCAGDDCYPFLNSAEIYNPSTGAFRSAVPMAVSRARHTSTALQDGRVLVAGGCSSGGAIARAEVYDEQTGEWMRVGEMTEPRCSHIAVPLIDGRVLMMSGSSGRLGHIASAEIFDPEAMSFSSLSGMKDNHYLATRLADGRVLLTGGQSEKGVILASVEIFDPATDRFEMTGDMTMPRVKHAASVLSDGRVLVIGGSDRRGYKGRFKSTEIYNPRTGQFSPGPKLQYRRHKIRDAVVALPSGVVVVAGGAVRPELYDPAYGGFVVAPGKIGGPHMFATASLLMNGDVLVLGGYDRSQHMDANAWVVAESQLP